MSLLRRVNVSPATPNAYPWRAPAHAMARYGNSPGICMGGGECLGNGVAKFPGAPREVREAWNLYMGDPEGWAGPYGGRLELALRSPW